MKSLLFRGGIAALVGLTATTTAHANAQGAYGYGSRSSALAGAVTASVSDSSANYYNPAGLVAAPTVRLDLGYHWAEHRLRTNGRDNGVDPAHGISAGAVAPGRVFGFPFAFGFGLYLPDDRLSRSRSLPQAQPRWEFYDNRVQILSISANVAVAPWRWLRLGGGLSFVSSTRGRLDIYGDFDLLRAADSDVAHAIDADLRSVRYPQLGVQVDLPRGISLGLTWRGSYSIALELDATVGGNVVIGGIRNPGAVRIPGTYSLSSSSIAVFLPQQAALGASWKPIPSLNVLLDVTWIDWPRYENPTAQLGTALNLQLPPELTSFTLPATPPPVVRVPASFQTTFVPRIAVEWQRAIGVHGFALRGGYRYEPSPVPDQTGTTNFLDSNRHGISAGTGFTLRGLRPVLNGGITLDINGELQVLEQRIVRKDDPTDPAGDYVLDGLVFNLGTTLSVVF